MTLLFSYLKQYKKLLILALVLAAVNQIFSLLDPQIFRLIIDRFASRAGQIPQAQFVRGVLILLFLSMGTALVSRIAKNFQDYYVNIITKRIGTKLYSQSVAHAFSLPYAVFEDQRSGELLQKFDKAKNDAQTIITSSINSVFLSLIGITFVLVYAFIVHWSIGLAYFLLMPTLATATFFVSKKIKTAQQEIVKELGSMAGSTTETLRNVELVKSLGLERQEIERLNGMNEKILALELKKVKLVRTMSFIQGTLINLLRSALLFLMLFLILRGTITLGEFFSLLFYSFFIFNPLSDLSSVAVQYQEARASMERVEQILAIPSAPKPEHPVHLETIRSIRYDHVSFNYESDHGGGLRDISLEIKAGETVAFVGPSGSGKSTMIKLLAGLYRPIKGKILINQADLVDLDLEDLRCRVGLVSQETQLFAGTFRENLLFARPDATDEECIAALNAASAMSILEKGSKGLDERIGEGGIKISGGERQRLAIARALLRHPEIIIFDEATSNLDSLTERAITETIRTINATHPETMSILIAHRLSTVAHAKRIYVLEKGNIIETGTHEELLKSGNLYSALWREQIAANGNG